MSLDWQAQDLLLLVGTIDGNGKSPNWVPITDDVGPKKDHAVVTDDVGDELKNKDHNVRYEGTISYRWEADTGLGAILGEIQLNDIYNDYCITEWTVSSGNTTWPEVAFTVHKHAQNNHSTGDMVKFTLPASFQTAMVGAFGAIDWFNNAPSGGAATASTLTFTCRHEDVPDAQGDHLWGNAAMGTLNASVTYHGHADDPGGDWVNFQLTPVSTNDGFDNSTATGTQYVARD